MAYSAVPQSGQNVIPTTPQAGVFPLRPESIPRGAAGHRPKRVGTSEPSVADTSGLLRFLILLVVISGLTCLYVWQANTIYAIRSETQIMTEEIRSLERQNVALMLEHARWDAPDYIEEESSQSGMVIGQAPVRVQLPRFSEPRAAAESDAEYGFSISQLTARLPGALTLGFQHK